MEIVTMKMEKDMLKRMDDLIKVHQYGTRTEFMRTALREKMSQLEKEELIKKMMVLKGISKRKTTDAELRRIREEAYEELIREKGWK